MNYILFGPPGIGKSTIISVLKSKGIRALDLEDIYPNRIRFQLPSMLDNVCLGAADLNPARRYNNAKKILLTADQSAYDERRAVRDAGQPGKARQMHHDVDQWAKAEYDLVIDTTKLTAERTADQIIQFMKGEEDGNQGNESSHK